MLNLKQIILVIIVDVNGDSKVNVKVGNRLYEHINETNPLW